MKTTLDLPDDLMHRIKIRAVHAHKKLKDEVADLLEHGMRNATAKETVPFVPKPLRLRGGFRPDIDDIEAAIACGRDD
jgi:plasmid stability protein